MSDTSKRTAALDAFGQARSESAHHRALAEGLVSQSQAAGDNPQGQELHRQALEALQLAAHFEGKAARHLDEWRSELLSNGEGIGEQTEADLTEDEQAKLRRAWYLPGTVAADPILQLEEAGMGGLLEQAVKYAGRSLIGLRQDGIHPDSLLAMIATAINEGLRPVGVTDLVHRHRLAEPATEDSVFEPLAAVAPVAEETPAEAPASDEGSLFQWLTQDDADLSRPGPLFEARGLTQDDTQAETVDREPDMEPDP